VNTVAGEELAAARTRQREDVLEVGRGGGERADEGGAERPSHRGEEEDERSAAEGLEAHRANVPVRHPVPRQMREWAERQRKSTPPGERSGGRPRGDVQRDDHRRGLPDLRRDTLPAMERVADGVYRFHSRFVNWYLVEDGERLAAIDAGLPLDWHTLHTAFTSLGRRPGDLAAVVLTHAHVDHLGFAERARRELGVRVYAPLQDADLLKHSWRRAKPERNPLGYARFSAGRSAIGAMLATHAFTAKPIRELTTYTDGETLDVPGSPRVVATPGHTWGHSSLHLEDRDVLFTADALVTCNPYTGETGPRIIASGATSNSAQALLSLDRIAETGVRVLLPGHGDPWRDGAEEAARLARVAGAS